MRDPNDRLEIYEKLAEVDFVSLTEARVTLGTASLQERLGLRFPYIFRRWAARNAELDQLYRETQIAMRDQRERRAREALRERELGTTVTPADKRCAARVRVGRALVRCGLENQPEHHVHKATFTGDWKGHRYQSVYMEWTQEEL